MSQSQGCGSYRILIVDDNEAIHRDFRTLLQARPARDELADLAMEVFGEEEPEQAPAVELPTYSFDSAYQGRAALESVKQASRAGQSYALAFVDVRMPPGWDGVETIQRIWEVDPNIQMVICSAYSDYSWDELVQTLGTTDKLLFLRKPFDPHCVKQMALAITCKWSRDHATRDRIAQLGELLGRRDEELGHLRAELEHLAAELERFKAMVADEEAPGRSERTARLGTKIRALLDALESLSATRFSEEQRHLIELAVSSGRALIDDLMAGTSQA